MLPAIIVLIVFALAWVVYRLVMRDNDVMRHEDLRRRMREARRRHA